MKKTVLYMFLLAIVSFTFFACEDPYADQEVASPTISEQPAVQSANFTAKLNVNPLVITKDLMAQSLKFISITSEPSTLVDTLTTIQYQVMVSYDSSMNPVTSKYLTATKQNNDLYVDCSQINDALYELNPNATGEQSAYVRLLAYLIKDGTKVVNYVDLPFTVSTLPLKNYYETTVKPWFIVGSMGGWTNSSVTDIGSSLIPLNVVSGFKYNESGDGEFVYTGYFKASDEFVIVKEPGSWSKFANDGGKGIDKPVSEGSGNFQVPADGYYTITLNSIRNTCTIVSATAPATSYASIGMIGGFNGWGSDYAMTANASTNNHVWYTTITFTGETQFKFRANGGWDINWGAGSSDGDPIYQYTGIGTNGGHNIYGTAGTYVAVFNDITGCYQIFVK